MTKFLSTYLFFVLLLLGSTAAQALRLPTGQPVRRSLAEVLNPDGTLRAGADGSFDAHNFQLALAPDGRPTFQPLRATSTADQRWQDNFGLPNGTNSQVQVIVQSGNNTYVGGTFKVVGTVGANCVARWNGTVWSSLGTGPANGVGTPTSASIVNALAVAANGDLYVGGNFTLAGGQPASNLARWNGTAWSTLGSVTANGVSGAATGSQVNALAVAASGDLYVGGVFTQAGPVAATNVARWNGTGWASLGVGTTNGLNDVVKALAVAPTGDVYAGGSFTLAGGAAASNVARWNGTAWNALGTATANGTNAPVNALAIAPSGDVYVGGNFTQAAGLAAPNIARWTGTAWASLGTGVLANPTTEVDALTINSTGRLYVGGLFEQVGGVAVHNLAQWNGTAWATVGTATANGASGFVLALATTATGQLYVGGAFRQAGDLQANNIARYTGLTWNPLGVNTTNGVNSTVSKVVVAPNGDVYVGGFFSQVGNVPANAVARWNGTTWATLGTATANGVNGYIDGMALAPNGDLYVGGNFTQAGGLLASNVARWNGTAWASLGTGAANGVDAPVYVITVSAAGLVYVGGSFSNAGGQAANRIARWNGTAWASLGTGTANGLDSAGPFALAFAANGDLYVAGIFSNAGGQAANAVAKWNGTAWSSLGTGTNNGVAPFAFALAFAPNGDLYVGGDFTQAGTTPASGIARWNGTAWSAVGNTTSAFVRALAFAPNGDLYLGGSFTEFAGQSLNQVARWDGTTWSPLGTGLNDAVVSLAVGTTGKVYAGGTFSTVGDGSKVTVSFGVYDPNLVLAAAVPAALAAAILFPNPAHDAATLRLPAGAPLLPLTLTDGLGRVVRHYPAPVTRDATLDLRGLPAGLYLVQGSGVTQRLVVE